MGKALRWSEKWFRRGLWLVAFVFAWFLVGLGSTIVGDLPRVEQAQGLDDFLDPQRAPQVRQDIAAAQRAARTAQDTLDQAQLRHQAATANQRAARDSFDNWLGTRQVTQRPEQDEELINRTRQLESLRQTEREALAAVETQQQAALDAQQAEQRAQDQMLALEEGARDAYVSAQRAQELRVFLYRLALTLPLLVVAGWLFAKQRKSTYWPFVWGFIFFALFAFFVELVPYLPSYGGYVRYIVGIVLTVVGGRYAIQALQRYLARQQQAEALPDRLRRQELDYDLAQTRLAKGVCPGCERGVDLKDPKNDFCPHCGMGLHNHCTACNARKSAFARYCYACGEPAARAEAVEAPGAVAAQPVAPGAAPG